MTQRINRNQLLEASDLSYRSEKSKNISKYGPIKVNFEILHILESSILAELLKGFYVKTAFSCKNGLLSCYFMPILCRDSQTSRAFKLTFSLICYDIII